MEFDEARHYQWGDDAKSIDWNASARLGTPFIKVFREERELTILLLLDTSASMRCGASGLWGYTGKSKEQSLTPYEQALITAALIAFSAERSGQRVGAFLFDRIIDRVFPPRKGRRNIMAFISGALQYQKQGMFRQRSVGGATSNIRSAITGAGRLLKRRSMVILISDFLSAGWEQELSELCRRHDVIAIRVSDTPEGDLPDLGLITLKDPETSLRIDAPTGYTSFREAWSQWHEDRADLWFKLCRRAGAAQLEIPVNADAAPALVRFFGGRGGR